MTHAGPGTEKLNWQNKTMKPSAILILLLTFGLARSNAQTQNVFPSYADSATWHVLDCYWMDCITHVDKFDGIVEMCGHEYSRVTFSATRVVYFRSDTLRTFFRRSTDCNGKEYLIYDYSMEPGDTVWVGSNFGWSSQDTTRTRLMYIDTIEQFGIQRRRFNMHHGLSELFVGEFEMQMAWIEGIGSDIDPFYPFLCLQNGCETQFTTLCYDSAGTQLYQSPYHDTCSITIIGIEEIERGLDITVSPNPFTHSFRIESDARILDAQVYSILGALVGSFEGGEMTMEVVLPQHLSNGLYILRTRTERGFSTFKVLKASP